MSEDRDLYDVAKRITLEAGFDWTDPRTLKTYKASEHASGVNSDWINTVDLTRRPGPFAAYEAINNQVFYHEGEANQLFLTVHETTATKTVEEQAKMLADILNLLPPVQKR